MVTSGLLNKSFLTARKSYANIGGTFQEHLVVEYQVERVNGIPTNQLWIQYPTETISGSLGGRT